MMKNSTFFLFLILSLGIVKNINGSISETLPAILDEFQINQPIVMNKMLDTTEFTKVVKGLSYQGYKIGFSQNEINQYYQSYVIFTDLSSNFKWNQKTNAPLLVVTNIENEVGLQEVEVSIGSEVLFLDLLSLKVYEAYTVNEMHIVRFLGQFQEYDALKKIPRFFQSEDYIPSIEKRRRNLYGLQISCGIFGLRVDPAAIYPDQVKFFPNNNTYDVSSLVGNPKYDNIFFNYHIAPLRVLKLLETQLNFTSKVFLRKDMKLGSPPISSNGTPVIVEGLFQDMVDGAVEFIPQFLVMLPERAHFGDFLPAVKHVHDKILIPVVDSSEAFYWNTFLDPFSTKLWLAIILKCIIFSILVFIIEWLHSYKLVSEVIDF